MKNINLNKISISNARRFAKDVEIDFGKGATIILAPNGTGKTTIFEAIELALTGSLASKLGDPPNAFIRDGKKELDIRLDFDNDIYCEVTFRHGNKPLLKGNHEELFKDKLTSLPYLLGITHILDQRSKCWFVTSEEKEAGSILDKLSIGNGLNRIFSKKSNLIKTVNLEIKNLEHSCNEALKKRNDFLKLIKDRNLVSSNYNLVPLNIIYQKINSGNVLINNCDSDIKLNPQSLSLFLETTKKSLYSELDSKMNLKIKYSSIESKLDNYKENMIFIENKESDLEINITKVSQVNSKIEKLRDMTDASQKSKLEIIAQQNQNMLIRNSLISLHDKREKYMQESTIIESLKIQLPIKQNNFTESCKDLDRLINLKNEHKILDSEMTHVSSKLESIEKLFIMQEQFASLEKEKTDIEENKIPNYEKVKFELTQEIKKIEENQIKNNLEIDQTKEIINKFIEGSDAIKSSINNISKYLPADECRCPVCNTNFEPKELQNQIKIALDFMNPTAHKMTQNLKISEEAQRKFVDDSLKLSANLESIILKINQEKDILENIREKLSEIILFFPSCINSDDALNFITSLMDTQNNLYNQLLIKKNTLEINPSENTISDKRIENEKINIEVDKLKSEIKSKDSIINLLSKEILSLEEKTKNSNLDKVNADISALNLEIDNLCNLYIDYTAKLESLQKELHILQVEIHKINDNLLNLKSHQIQIETEWFELELPGKPNQESLFLAKTNIENYQKNCSDSLNQLKDVQKQLVAWKETEILDKLNKEIKLVCGENSEDEHLLILSSTILSIEERIGEINNKKELMSFLFSEVDSELNKVNTYIDSINEPWSELLNRTIVNSRFSTGELLKSNTVRNKPMAQIEAILNGKSVPVSQIASEAQLTDLQLTFMLAMAKQHHWSPWRALLLDDPTQHHDLVHASSVFDLLRDYISDLDFQVMLSTHDSQQVNFFRRKLDNDGIENKVYRLIAGRDGVFAELI